MKTPRQPAEIQADIDKLKEELIESNNFHRWVLIYKDDCHDEHKSHEKIGFFNITKTRAILERLHGGQKLKFDHGVYGNVEVVMNQQCNRILTNEEDPNGPLGEENILKYIMGITGDWYVEKKNS